jgi:hypothetical protein
LLGAALIAYQTEIHKKSGLAPFPAPVKADLVFA